MRDGQPGQHYPGSPFRGCRRGRGAHLDRDGKVFTGVIHVRDVSKDNKDPSLKAKARTNDSSFVLKDNQGPRPRTTSLAVTRVSEPIYNGGHKP